MEIHGVAAWLNTGRVALVVMIVRIIPSAQAGKNEIDPAGAKGAMAGRSGQAK